MRVTNHSNPSIQYVMRVTNPNIRCAGDGVFAAFVSGIHIMPMVYLFTTMCPKGQEGQTPNPITLTPNPNP